MNQNSMYNDEAPRKQGKDSRQRRQARENKRQHGYTLIELLFVLVVVGSFAGAIGVAYVAWHFISKFW